MSARSCRLHVPAGVVLARSGGAVALGLDPTVADGDREVDDLSGLLGAFLRLDGGRPKRFLSFARRYGLLYLCEHDLPATHPPLALETAEARRDTYPCFPLVLESDGRERIDAWRVFPRAARAFLAIAAKLKDGEPGHPEDWWALARVPFRDGHESEIRPHRSGIEQQASLLAQELGRWLRLGRVGPVARGSEAPFNVGLQSSGLFPAIATLLSVHIIGLGLIEPCVRCSGPCAAPAAGGSGGGPALCGRCAEGGVPGDTERAPTC